MILSTTVILKVFFIYRAQVPAEEVLFKNKTNPQGSVEQRRTWFGPCNVDHIDFL